MKTIVIDCTGIGSADEFWERYLSATEPEGAHYFGRNLDAFWDAVEGGGPGWPGEVKLLILNSSWLSGFTNRGGTRSFLDSIRDIAAKTTVVPIELA